VARRFQASQLISFPVPAALIGVDGGPLTIIACFKINTSAYQVPLYSRTSGGTHAWWAEVDTTGGLHVNYGTGTTARNVGTVTTGAYMIGVWRKDAGGTFQPVGRHLTGAGFATDSGNITAASTLIDGSALDSGGSLVVGRWGPTDYSGDLEVAGVAVITSYLADGSIPGLTTWAAITALATWWASFEGSTVTDKAGGTPTITGATVVTDPSGFFSSSVSAVLAAPLGGLAAAMTAAGSSPATLAAPLGGLAAAMTAAGSSPATLAAPLGGLAAAMTAAGSSPATLAAPLGGLAAAMTAVPSTPDPGHVDATFAAVLGGLAAAMLAVPRDPTTTGIRAVMRPAPAPAPELRPGPAAAPALRPA
jgi:hypothetical protein